MTGSTKILTVSYGTFSCTLEGFDDPFATMRGIAEYFRDLAADDRYFGAEPPTPDVEMLQRIAEQEVQRRVDARVADTGIALTQVTDAPVAEPEPVVEDAAVEPEVAAEPEPTPVEPPVAAEKPAEEPEVDLDSGPLALEDDYLLSDEPEDVLAVDPAAKLEAEGPAETVAEKLRRIRAVVSRSIEPEAGDSGQSFSAAQAQPAIGEQDAPRRARALTETIRQISEDLTDDEDAAADAENAFEDVAEEVAAAPEQEAVAAEPVEAVEDDALDAEEEFVDDNEAWALLDDDGIDEEPVDEVPVEDAPQDEAASASDADTIGDVLSKVRAAEDVPTPAEEPKPSASADSPAEPVAEADPEVPAKKRPTTRPLTPISDTNGDVGRLLAETNNHMKDDEGVRRRRVISQMRAAVAATKADRLVSRRVTSPDEMAAAEKQLYQDVLKEAVRKPSYPPSGNSDRVPTVAPLVLVSSQRVDAGDAPKTPTKPQPAKAPAGSEGFAEFAKNMGAKELPELLEAAAAYSSFVEGQPSFSRPEIMKRVARVDPTLKLSREDGLRSFGKLLRQGKFRKLEPGQFTIDESTQ